MKQNRLIAVLPGDGIGPEIIDQAIKVAKAADRRFGLGLEFEYGMVGACAIDACGDPYPAETDALCKRAGAVLFGAMGDPKYDNDPSAKVRPEQGLLRMRKSLELYANIRPLCPYDRLLDASPLKRDVVSGCDMIVVRELTGGLYFGEPRGRSEDDSKSFDTCVYSRGEIRRIARIGFDYAMRRRKHVTLVDKANILATSRMWRDEVTRMAREEYPEVQLDYMYVDNAAMKLVLNPCFFDVLLTENLFGDILSDLCGAIGGSIGMMPSASVGTEHALYEPIHGSFPQAKGLGIANPLATILSLAMLLEGSFGETEAAAAIRSACAKSVSEGLGTPDIFPDKPVSTSEIGDYIAYEVENC